jgi:transposase
MKNKKIEALRKTKNLHLNSEMVQDMLFIENAFFDAHDLIQVKYEMLRRYCIDRVPVQQVVTSFGFSRVTFYETLHTFEVEGLFSLQPKKRGPKQGHKLTFEILEFAKEKIRTDPNLQCEDLLKQIKDTYEIKLHKRTLERGLKGKKKYLY